MSSFYLLLQDLLEKLKEAEESHSTLQAECEQYRTVLAETVMTLNYFDSKTCSQTIPLHLIGFLCFSRKEC